MASNSEHDEPAFIADKSYQKGNYEEALQQLEIVEAAVGANNKLQHNKALIKFMQSGMADVNSFVETLCGVLGVKFPEIDNIDCNNPFHVYNYAVFLYHATYYSKCTCLLDKLLLNFSNIKDKMLKKHIVMLSIETNLCCYKPDRTLDIARKYSDVLLGTSELTILFERAMCRASLMKGRKPKQSLKQDIIENLFITAHEQLLNNDKVGAMNTLMKYKTIKHNYNYKTQGEEIWPALKNNLGIIYLSINKYFLAKINFQEALKEHLKSVETMGNLKFFTSKDRPLYVYNLGLSLLAANLPEGAFECFTEASQSYPNNARIWLRLAECCVKRCCKNEGSRYIQKLIGNGRHTRFFIYKEKLIRNPNPEVPSLSLEFALHCLETASIILSKHDQPQDLDKPFIELPPTRPISWRQRSFLVHSIIILQAYILLYMGNFEATLKTCREILTQHDVGNGHKALAHIYAADALNNLGRQKDAVDHLHPQVMQSLTSSLPSHIKESIDVAFLGKMADIHIRSGNLENARMMLLPLHTPDLLPLQIYLMLLSADLKTRQNFLRSRMRLTPL